MVTILTEAGASTTFFSLPEAAVTIDSCNLTLRVALEDDFSFVDSVVSEKVSLPISSAYPKRHRQQVTPPHINILLIVIILSPFM
ncbi:hypothetical protein [Helicobacter typhlonius]|uniref:hypothetical protein n=1 Tax=Helicobacter typhlonius TaxID=76936 RepID=UPI002FE084CA